MSRKFRNDATQSTADARRAATATAAAATKAAARTAANDRDTAAVTLAGITAKADQLASLQAACKAAYQEIDRLEADLIEAIGIGSVRLADGRTVSVKDNFVDKFGQPRNVAYKPCGVKRFVVETK